MNNNCVFVSCLNFIVIFYNYQLAVCDPSFISSFPFYIVYFVLIRFSFNAIVCHQSPICDVIKQMLNQSDLLSQWTLSERITTPTDIRKIQWLEIQCFFWSMWFTDLLLFHYFLFFCSRLLITKFSLFDVTMSFAVVPSFPLKFFVSQFSLITQ